MDPVQSAPTLTARRAFRLLAVLPAESVSTVGITFAHVSAAGSCGALSLRLRGRRLGASSAPLLDDASHLLPEMSFSLRARDLTIAVVVLGGRENLPLRG